jgi:glycosyltransferase involved in cell wall biosynthesis
MRILFFTESLTCGGKERRILELIQYLKEHTDHTITLVLTENLIHYDYVYDMDISIKVIKRRGVKYDPMPFIKFYRYCRQFKPDIIHTWGRMTTFYAIPAKLLRGVPLISSTIANAIGEDRLSAIDRFFFHAGMAVSDIILANSLAGLKAYKITSPKAKVVWNGVHLERFRKTYDTRKVREELSITTKFMVVMVAAFSELKDYDLFIDVARDTGKKREDVTFVGVGDGDEWPRIKKRTVDEKIGNVVLTGKQKDVERIISASDIGMLCTYTEGISNSIIECMALGKPMISTDTEGGSREIILEGETGYCVERNSEKIVSSLELLLNNPELCSIMGNKGKERVETQFSIDKMGKEFENVYNGFATGVKTKK